MENIETKTITYNDRTFYYIVRRERKTSLKSFFKKSNLVTDFYRDYEIITRKILGIFNQRVINPIVLFSVNINIESPLYSKQEVESLIKAARKEYKKNKRRKQEIDSRRIEIEAGEII